MSFRSLFSLELSYLFGDCRLLRVEWSPLGQRKRTLWPIKFDHSRLFANKGQKPAALTALKGCGALLGFHVFVSSGIIIESGGGVENL
jgi:hypothetical protein